MKKIEEIIESYKNNEQKKVDECIAYCKSLESLEEVIKCAAAAENKFGKMHSHQHRIAKLALISFKENLPQKKREIEAAKTFEDLLKIVEDCGSKIKRIGELSCYDAALRIGARLNIEPTKVYLHAGTREGIKNLLHLIKRESSTDKTILTSLFYDGGEKFLSLTMKEKFINKDILPIPFHDKDLKDSDIEVLFCNYKKHLL